MYLKPIAKPVRIRIMSGGEEHSSLESLKHNFSLVDIKPLLDNRLIRWLERQGKEASLIAEELKSFDAESLEQENGQFAFIQLFFSDEVSEHSLHSLPEIARYWIENQQYERNGSHLLKIIPQIRNRPHKMTQRSKR